VLENRIQISSARSGAEEQNPDFQRLARRWKTEPEFPALVPVLENRTRIFSTWSGAEEQNPNLQRPARCWKTEPKLPAPDPALENMTRTSENVSRRTPGGASCGPPLVFLISFSQYSYFCHQE